MEKSPRYYISEQGLHDDEDDGDLVITYEHMVEAVRWIEHCRGVRDGSISARPTPPFDAPLH